MINGILVVDKPAGYTSRDVVNRVGKILHTKKIGHTGTLDPIATGVLVLTIGKATKISELLVANQKEYVAEALLGMETDTLDHTGNRLKAETALFSKTQIEEVLQRFIGSYEQEVPIYSAVKIGGKKLYEYARNGEAVELPKREVTISQMKLLDCQSEGNQTKITFSCVVSKGTYIRSLIRDIANTLGTVGIMTNLRRTRQGEYGIADSYSLEDIEHGKYKIVSLLEVFQKYPQRIVDTALEKKIRNGAWLPAEEEELIVFIQDDVLALYQRDGDFIKPYKMFL